MICWLARQVRPAQRNVPRPDFDFPPTRRLEDHVASCAPLVWLQAGRVAAARPASATAANANAAACGGPHNAAFSCGVLRRPAWCSVEY